MEDISLLQKSFDNFTKATAELEDAYSRLEKQFENLNKELEEKNIELVRTVEEKEQTKNYLQNILENLINGVIVTDLQDRIQTINQCAEMFINSSQSEIAGKHISVIFEDMAGNNWQTINLDEYFKGEAGQKVKINGRTLEIFCSPFKSPEGEKIGNVFILRDITRIEKLEEMAKRSEKFAAMGEMAANIAHEIRNPLGSIELFASLLLKGVQDKKDHDRIVQIVSSVKNVDNKISNLLMFTKKQSPRMKIIKIQQVLQEVIDFSEQIMEQEDIKISVQYEAGKAYVAGDAEMLKQVFLNIILNAQQAMPEGGTLQIKTNIYKSGIVQKDLRAVEIIFQDSGQGIPQENLPKIFDPFFSTREGVSGLGLAIVHNIVSEHNGSINIDNSPQGGAIVNLTFPLVKGGSSD